MIRKIVVETLNQFVEKVSNCCRQEWVLFRGQRDAKWTLIPRIARIHPRKSIEAAEQNMLKELKTTAIPLIEHRPENSWEWLAIAQHHGMATRLLDWTLNPLAALWFAVQSPATSFAGAVWAFAPNDQDYVDESNDPFGMRTTKVFRPRHVTGRIIAQNGFFTSHVRAPKSHKFIPLEDNKFHKLKLTQFVIPKNSFAELRSELDRFGVNESTLFPDLTGLCKHIEWLHSRLNDEIKKPHQVGFFGPVSRPWNRSTS